jgi:hypothetical protein
VKKYRKRFRKLCGIFPEIFITIHTPYSVSYMHRTLMGCLDLTFSYMQCSNMLHECEEIQKKFTESFRKFSSLTATQFHRFEGRTCPLPSSTLAIWDGSTYLALAILVCVTQRERHVTDTWVFCVPMVISFTSDMTRVWHVPFTWYGVRVFCIV